MSRLFLLRTRYTIRVGLKKLGRTPVPKLPSRPPPPKKNVHVKWLKLLTILKRSEKYSLGGSKITCGICEKVYFDQLIAFIILSHFLSMSYITLWMLDVYNAIRVSNSLDPDEARHLSGLIWVQTVSKGYQQTTKVAPSGQRILFYHILVQMSYE